MDSAPYRVLAVDGRDVNGPTPVEGQRVSVPAGGRYDLEVTAPARVQIGSTALVVGDDPGAVAAAARQARHAVVRRAHGAAVRPGRRRPHVPLLHGPPPGFLDGKPGFWWSINGHLWPDVPMYLVDEGDVVVFEIENHSGEVHPMHLHGHHAVVLSRDGEPATGSPWWVDSLDVENGETMTVAFVADNPGIWMDHCHNLKHAAAGAGRPPDVQRRHRALPARRRQRQRARVARFVCAAERGKSGKPQTNRGRSPHSGWL